MKKMLQINKLLSNITLFKIRDNDLNQEEIIKLWSFLNLIIASRNCYVAFRGESNDNFQKQFNGCSTNYPSILTDYLFMTGEKSKQLWNQKMFYDPDNTSFENFITICEALKNYIINGLNGDSSRSIVIKEFYSNNRLFCDGLNTIENYRSAYDLLNDQQKRSINLYYLSIAHTINSSKYKIRSNFVSSTTSFNVANRFCSDAIIVGWVPKCNNIDEEGIIDYVDIENLQSTVIELGLPVCETPVYKGQNEIAWRSGFLPHYMIGVLINQSFYVNPAILDSIDEIRILDSATLKRQKIDDIVVHGLKIDQGNFEEFCKQTGFKRYYLFDGHRYEIHNLENDAQPTTQNSQL